MSVTVDRTSVIGRLAALGQPSRMAIVETLLAGAPEAWRLTTLLSRFRHLFRRHQTT
jgi:hypothetical protein